ncbi:MAG: hypothetical protein KatS3mg105_4046 [Gemmatales bacterium]|nr:MAG: hypothetical protein KatS3mg105_4046 [Gemmatales bacterium]
MSSPALGFYDLLTYLDRQQSSRLRGCPNVTVLQGPLGLARHVWESWCQRTGRPVASCDPAEPISPESIGKKWFETLASVDDLYGRAVACLARASGLDAGEIETKLAISTGFDLDAFYRRCRFAEDDPAVALARLIIEKRRAGQVISAEDVVRLEWRTTNGRPPWLKVFQSATGLVSVERLPALFLTARAPAELSQAASWLEIVCEEIPSMPVAISAQGKTVRDFLKHEAPSRLTAIVREGAVVLRAWEHEEVRHRLEKAGIDGGKLCRASAQLGGDALWDDVAESFVELGQHRHGKVVAGIARSSAEQFLFDFLESHPATTGLFRLNSSLDFSFGPGVAEVDLFCPELRLVIEIDGYFHFQDPEHYRRDRRKDFLLQKQGYVVLRFLADDIACRLEEIAETIMEAIVHCRSLRGTRRTHGD